MATVTTASTKRLVNVTGLVIECPFDPVAGNRLCWDRLMLKPGVRLITPSVASMVSLLRSTPASGEGAAA